MPYVLNSKIRELKPYDPIQGRYPVRLDANESFCKPPAELLARITEAIASIDFNRYPDPYAKELCRSFADYYGVGADNVTAGNGSDELISVIMGSFVQKGESVMTLSPDFSMYRFYSSMNETKCVEYQKAPDFSVGVDELVSLVKNYDVRLLIFSNPCNPTGRGICREEMRRLVHSVDALVVLDEAYMDFWDQSLVGETENYDNLIVLRTCSKLFGMAAARLGFAVANPSLTGAIRAVKSPYNVSACTQKIGSIVYREREWIASCLREIRKSQAELFTVLCSMGKSHGDRMTVFDSVTNFTFLRAAQAGKIYEELLDSGIVVRRFGDYLRITAGTHEENMVLIKQMERILSEGRD